MDLVARGRITPMVDQVFPIEEIARAFDALREGRPIGRNVVEVSA
jgi:D-arabinose 1-dehydrogenase-like Zn-dependent alcohol dehydrogenase